MRGHGGAQLQLGTGQGVATDPGWAPNPGSAPGLDGAGCQQMAMASRPHHCVDREHSLDRWFLMKKSFRRSLKVFSFT